jgi:hypothetical protein
MDRDGQCAACTCQFYPDHGGVVVDDDDDDDDYDDDENVMMMEMS